MRVFPARLDGMGGLSAELIEITSSSNDYLYGGNYLLVLKVSCDIQGVPLSADMLVVARELPPQPFMAKASPGSSACLATGVSF